MSSCKKLSEPSSSRQQAQSGNARKRKIPEDIQDTRQSHEVDIINKQQSKLLKRKGKIVLL